MCAYVLAVSHSAFGAYTITCGTFKCNTPLGVAFPMALKGFSCMAYDFFFTLAPRLQLGYQTFLIHLKNILIIMHYCQLYCLFHKFITNMALILKKNST